MKHRVISFVTMALIAVTTLFSLSLPTYAQNRQVWAWGDNSRGQLGQINVTQRSSPVQVPGTTWLAISAGYYHILARKTDGTMWAWGYQNAYGGLGIGTTVTTLNPTQITGTQTYQAQPTPIAQLTGLGLSGLALSKALG